jgi:glutathione S-transferase
MSQSKGTLYFTLSSCGFASFLAAQIAGVPLTFEQVNIGTHKTASGVDFYTINPKGNVPTLVLPNGVVLNEGAATLQWIADQNPESKLAPAWGTVERYQLINLLNYVSSEVHASFGPLFNPALTGDARELANKRLISKFDYLEKNLIRSGKTFIFGDNFTIVDAYLYICLSWTPYVHVTLDNHTNLKAYFEGIKGLKVVQDAHAAANATPKA